MNKQQIISLIGRANSGERRSVKSPPPLQQHEREAIFYFFAKLKMLDPIAFDRAMPDDKQEKAVKTEFANSIRGFTKEQIDSAFGELKKQIGLGNPDFRFLSVARVVGFVANNGNPDAVRAGIYKIAPPVIRPVAALGSSIEAMRANTVNVLNPQTGEYGVAIAAQKSKLSKVDREQAETTLKKLSSLFEE